MKLFHPPAPEAVDPGQAKHESLDALDDARLHHHNQEDDEALKSINFKKLNFQILSTRVRFSPGFPPGAGLPGEHVFREFSGPPAVIRATLEQIPVREILLLEEILG
jgi:hypothetical protein